MRKLLKLASVLPSVHIRAV